MGGTPIKKVKKITRGILVILIFYLLYTTIFGIVVFHQREPDVSNYKRDLNVNKFYGESVSQDRVVLLEEKIFSASARVNLLENAENSIDVAYYTIHEGYIADLFVGMIFDAADRGVKVRILLDGIFHNLRGNFKHVLYAFIKHPNIEIKFYEPFKPFQPWTWNNRFHDKMIVIDQKYAVIGGRNVGNRYFIQEGKKAPTNDRDVLIINTDEENPKTSVLFQMDQYFNEVWNHSFSKYPLEKLSDRQENKAARTIERLEKNLHQLQTKEKDLFKNSYKWVDLSLPTRKITFIRNPLQRYNKEPWVWYELSELAKQANKSVVIQSPYVIPTEQMLQHADPIFSQPKKTIILTNSLASTANVIAFSGYTNHRDKLVKSGINVLEYQGPDSLHAKTWIIDNRLTAIGAFNVDSRSTFLSTETMVVIDSVEFAERLNEEMDHYYQKSLQAAENSGYKDEGKALVNKGKVSFWKSITVKGLSYITSMFENML
jgi:cardiolipin synthase C